MPMRKYARAAAAALLLAFFPPSFLSASGFSIYEQGGRGMGFSGAYTALSDDPSAIFYNAAGIAFLRGKQIYLGGTLVAPRSNFTGDDPFPGAADRERQNVGLIPVPTFYYTQKLRDRLVVGFGVDSPYGLKTEWDHPDTYSGRFISLEADLKSISLNPTIAYKLADRLSIGGGLDFRFSKVKLRRRVPSINPFTQKVIDVAEVQLESSWNHGLGFNVGLLAKPTENLSLGLAYRHKVKVDYEGTAAFTQIATGNAQVDAAAAAALPAGRPALTTSITFPAILNGGAAYHWDKWTASADVVWFQWSTFDQLRLDCARLRCGEPDDPGGLLEHLAVPGGSGAPGSATPGPSGAAATSTRPPPSPAASVSPLLPDQDRHGFALGGSWTGGRLRLDAGAWYLHLSPRSSEGLNRDNYNGTYDNSAFTFGLSLGYSF